MKAAVKRLHPIGLNMNWLTNLWNHYKAQLTKWRQRNSNRDRAGNSHVWGQLQPAPVTPNPKQKRI